MVPKKVEAFSGRERSRVAERAGARCRNPDAERSEAEGALKQKAPRNLKAAQGLISVVPKKGLEPPHPCGYMDLNHARLPIPPLRL